MYMSVRLDETIEPTVFKQSQRNTVTDRHKTAKFAEATLTNK